MMVATVLLVCVAVTARPLSAQSVSAQHGNIVFTDATGRMVRLTDSGQDFAPSLSPNGALVVFVRHTPGEFVEVGWGDAEAREIWVISPDGRNPTMLVRGAEKDSWEDRLAQLDRPQFLSDSQRIVFDSALAAVDGTINVANPATGVRRIGGGHGVEVVRSGPYRDHLIVRRHRYFRGGGSYDYFWLITIDGDLIGPIGPDDADVARFKVAFASASSTPAAPFTWACADLRGVVDDSLGRACDEAVPPDTPEAQSPATDAR
jgi:hypothetical protein